MRGSGRTVSSSDVIVVVIVLVEGGMVVAAALLIGRLGHVERTLVDAHLGGQRDWRRGNDHLSRGRAAETDGIGPACQELREGEQAVRPLVVRPSLAHVLPPRVDRAGRQGFTDW